MQAHRCYDTIEYPYIENVRNILHSELSVNKILLFYILLKYLENNIWIYA